MLANINGTLTFGTDDGRVCRFKKDYSPIANFNDDGVAIHAKWTTPELYGNNFYYKKRFKTMAVMVGAAVATGVRMLAKYDGQEELLADYTADARYFAFSNISFSKLCFKTDKTGQIFKEKFSVKPDNRKAQFVLENDVLNEPLALHGLTIEFMESR